MAESLAEAREHHGHCERFAAEARTPALRDDWLAAAAYWQGVINTLQRGDTMDRTITMGQAVKFVREDGHTRDALVTRIQEDADLDHNPTLDLVSVNDDGTLEPRGSVQHSNDLPPMTAGWRRTTDHPTTAEFARESAR